jgi:hypothetical protein
MHPSIASCINFQERPVSKFRRLFTGMTITSSCASLEAQEGSQNLKKVYLSIAHWSNGLVTIQRQRAHEKPEEKT